MTSAIILFLFKTSNCQRLFRHFSSNSLFNENNKEITLLLRRAQVLQYHYKNREHLTRFNKSKKTTTNTFIRHQLHT